MVDINRIVVMDSENCSMGRWISIIVGDATGLKLYESRELCALADEDWLTPAYLDDFDARLVGCDPAEVAADPEFQRVHEALSRAIRKAAEAGPCFIHERAASTIRADRDDLLRVMLYGSNVEDKYPRVIIDPTVPLGEDATREQLDAELCAQDQRRSVYHDAVAAIPWGDKRGYDLCLDSSALSREKCAEMIIAALQPCALDPERCAEAVDRFMASFK